MTLRGLAAAAAALALAFGAGLLVARARPEAGAAPAASAPAPAAPAAPAAAARVIVERAAAPAPRGPSLDEIRAAVRDELGPRADEAPAPPPRRVEDVRAAVARASAAVAEGIRRGVWSEPERAELRLQLVQLGPAEIHEVLTPLFQAINAQQLQLEGPPI